MWRAVAAGVELRCLAVRACLALIDELMLCRTIKNSSRNGVLHAVGVAQLWWTSSTI